MGFSLLVGIRNSEVVDSSRSAAGSQVGYAFGSRTILRVRRWLAMSSSSWLICDMGAWAEVEAMSTLPL